MKLIYEDTNSKTGYLYQIYSRGFLMSDMTYNVYEMDNDGNRKFITDFSELDNAIAFVRDRCK